MIPRICGVALLCVLLSVILDKMGFRSGGLFGVLCSLLVLSSLADSFIEMSSPLLSLADSVGISEAAAASLRAIGLGYVFGFTSDICQSLGESTLARAVVIVGRIEIFLVAYPYFEKLISLGVELFR